jgi:hypothetical protein
MAITLALASVLGDPHVLATLVDSFADQVFPLGPKFLINSGKIPLAPSALPFLTAFSAASMSFFVNSLSKGVDSLRAEISFISDFLTSGFILEALNNILEISFGVI